MFKPETAQFIGKGKILDRRKIGDTWVWFCDMGYGYQPYFTCISGHNTADLPEWPMFHSRFTRAYENFASRINKQWELVS